MEDYLLENLIFNYSMQSCECALINPQLNIKTGGTMGFKTDRAVTCTNCHQPHRGYYYVHQCLKLKHALCYSCLETKGVCRKCQHYYTCTMRL